MKKSLKRYPAFVEREISICDSEIDKIIFEDDVVRFCFTKGFYRLQRNELIHTKRGCIEFSGCSADEFTCYYVERQATNDGAEMHSRPLSLTELGRMISKNERRIELFLELYDFNYLYWRGVMLPYKDDGLSDHIVIEMSGFYPMTYFWE